jgi:lipid A 3-O-deacylase
MIRLPDLFICLGIFLLPVIVPAQAIDNTLSFRNINTGHYFRVNYENDFFTASDRDYTQGIYIEWVNPTIRHFPLTFLLWRPSNSMIKYGLALENNAYTPLYIDRPQVQYGDRPYAGVILLKTFLTAINDRRGERITTQFSAGIIGSWAGDEDMQKDIHHWIHYIQPLGWDNQIKNDLALNYQLNYEREFLRLQQFSLSSNASARIGTLSTKASLGITGMLGNFYTPFSSGKCTPVKKVQFYLYDMPALNAVGYDATLQGGLFNRSSVYTIPDKDINRIVFVNKWGIVLILKRLYFEYYQSWSSPEFSTTVYHRSGGLQIGWRGF